MSKVISSHNLAQLYYIKQDIEKYAFAIKILLEKSYEIKDEHNFDVIYSILDDSVLKLENAVDDLKAFDICIRSESDFNSVGDIND